MILTYKCDNCNKIFKLPFKENDRGELNRKKELFAICSYCCSNNRLLVNNVKAVLSPYINYAYGIALLMNIFIFVLAFIFYDVKMKSSNTNWQYYAIALVFLIPFLIAKVSIENDLKSVKIFNSYYV